VVSPLYSPFSTAELARALLLVRLRPDPPPVCLPCEKRLPAALSEHTFRREILDLYEPSRPVPFSVYLRRQNEEFRAAQQRLDWCPRRNSSPAKPAPRVPERQPMEVVKNGAARTDQATMRTAAQRQAAPATRRQIASTGRLVDVFI
jgi:hypothetical protein